MTRRTIIKAFSCILVAFLPLAQSEAQTFTVYSPDTDEDHYVNNAVVTHFKGKYYCMWQSSQKQQGRYKTLGYSYPKTFVHNGWIYISYSENKEKIMTTRIRIK